MSINKELLKSSILILILIAIATYGSLSFLETNESQIFSISLISLIALTYLVLLKNDLEQIKNEYDRDISEHNKQWKKEVEDAQADLEKRGMTFSGEGVKKLGTLSAYADQPKGEIENNRDDYKEYRNKKFKLDFTRAKYLVLINLFKFKN